MKCYKNKILRINLTYKSIKEEPLDMDLANKYIGGRGLGTAMLMKEIDPSIDPMSEHNKMILLTGPLSGTRVSTGTRYMAITKSPLNNMVACSNSGGKWGSILKFAGYDGIIIEGKSDVPVYISIKDEEIEINDARDLWGKTSEETVSMLNPDKNTSVLNISPAGENLSLMSAIMNDTDRAAGRTGVGAVLGYKKLKAIVVSTKTEKLETSDEELFRNTAHELAKKIKDHPVSGQGLKDYGTAVLVNIINGIGSFPTNNFQESEFEKADDVSGETMAEKALVRNSYCKHCTIGCGRVVKMGDKEVGGPEYETLWGYSGNAGISDLDSIIEANYWCNEMGLDTISTATTIAAAMELFQRGLIKEEDCEGVPLEFGNSKAIIEWTKRIGLAINPLAKLMGRGSYELCSYYGMPELSMSAKKLEMPAYDPRGIQGIGLNYATSNRGACHVRGYTISPEVLGVPELVDRKTIEGKAGLVKVFQDLTAVIDSLGMCLFTSFALGAEEYAAIFNAATGNNLSAEELMEYGERIYSMERLFNQKAGMRPEDDNLPKRMLEEESTSEGSKDMVNRLGEMLPEYYKLRGWVDGFPTEETLVRLGIK